MDCSQAICCSVYCAAGPDKIIFIREEPEEQEVSSCLEVSLALSDIDIYTSCMTNSGCPHSKPAPNCNTHFPRQSPYSLAWVFHQFIRKLSNEYWCRKAIRMFAVFFSTIHSLVVSVAVLHFMSYCLHGIERALGNCHYCGIFMTGTNRHDARYPFPIVRWLPCLPM